MDMEVSVPGSGFGEDAISVVSVEVVAAAKVIRRGLVLHFWIFP